MDQFQSTEPSDMNTGGSNLTQSSEAKDVGFVGRLFGILHAPGSSFAIINGKWEWLWVTLLLMALGFGALPLQKPYLLPDLKKASLENIEKFKDQMGEEAYQEAFDSIEKDMDENFELTPKTITFAFIGRLVATLIVGLFCWFVGNFISGGKAMFWQVLAVVAFAGVISLIHDYARGGMMVMNGTSYVYLGLGLMKPDPDSSFLYYFLRQIEFMTIWKVAAMAIALGSLYRIGAAKFAYALVPAWLIFMALVAAANIFAGGVIIY